MNAYDGGCGAGSGHDNSKRKIFDIILSKVCNNIFSWAT